MLRYWVLLIVSGVIMLASSTMDSTAYLSEEAPLCANWERNVLGYGATARGITGNACASLRQLRIAS